MIYIKNLKTGYRNKTVIKGISLSFQSGDFCALIGPNGAGKSTLLKSILGYLPKNQGDIILQNRSIGSYAREEIARNISLIPQSFNLQFDLSVYEIVLMGRFPYLQYMQSYKEKDHQIVSKVLEQLELIDLQNEMFNQLSGGEQQRVIIARSLVQDTPIILMDEAFSHLDINHQIETMHLLSEINREQNKTIILVSHNLNLVAEYCRRVIMLKDGKLVADGTPKDVIVPKYLNELYDMKLQVIQNPITDNPNVIFAR